MNLLTSFKIAGSGLQVAKVRLNVAATNIANAEVTKTIDGGPYVAKDVVVRAVPISDKYPFLKKVIVDRIEDSKAPFREVYDPTNPDADARGIVKYPNVDIITEMVELLSASRSYQANLTVLSTGKTMALRTIDLLKT